MRTKTARVRLECGRTVAVRCTFEVFLVEEERGKVALAGAEIETFPAQRVKVGDRYAVALPFRVSLPAEPDDFA